MPGMKPGQLAACSVSLVVAGLLLTRGFIGFNPGRPLFVVLGVVLAASATVGLAIDHVSVRSTHERPVDLLVSEMNRSRRYGHALCLVSVDCDDATADRMITLLRGSDRAWHQHHHELHLVLPETDRLGVLGFVARVDRILGPQDIRAAVFPFDALTVEGLEDALTPVDASGPIGRAAAPPAVTAPAKPTAVPDLPEDGPHGYVAEEAQEHLTQPPRDDLAVGEG